MLSRVSSATILERQDGDGRFARLDLQPVLHWEITTRMLRIFISCGKGEAGEAPQP
jgi:hypothetical protein